MARPIPNNARRLLVTWQNPSSWPDPESFPLKFFLRYRPLIIDQWQHVSGPVCFLSFGVLQSDSGGSRGGEGWLASLDKHVPPVPKSLGSKRRARVTVGTLGGGQPEEQCFPAGEQARGGGGWLFPVPEDGAWEGPAENHWQGLVTPGRWDL